MFGGGLDLDERPPVRRAPTPAANRRSPQPGRPPRRPAPPTVLRQHAPAYRGQLPKNRRPEPRHARPNPFRRLRLLVLVFLALFMAVVGRLTQLQVVDQSHLDALAESQVTRETTLPADRGSIVDRNGNELALSVARQTVWADPRYVDDPRGEAAQLAPILGVDVQTLQDRLTRPEGDAFEYLARQVDEEVARQVAELDLPGIYTMPEQARFHPAGDLARSVLGRVDLDGNGTAGLEEQYDDVLAGEPGEQVVERDRQGRTIPQGHHEVVPAVPGQDLVLTIDRAMQYQAEQALGRRIVEMGAKGGTVIVSDPRTGQILALANLTMDAETGQVVATGGNAALTSVFEPGSVNKIVTLSAALEEGVVTPDTHLDVPYSLRVADHDFTDSHPHPTSSWTPTDILATSSNIGTIMMARQLGPNRVDEYLRRFGFGSTTGLGFPNESAGLLLPVDRWSGTSIGSIPIGQGVAVTATQMLSAFNVIANGGEYVAPQLVLGTRDGSGEVVPSPPPATHRVISEQTADQVRDMMVAVVDAGTGEEAAIDGYSVAGKTGTARKPQDNGTYRDAAGYYHYVTTFAGFVPAQDPRLSVIVVIDEPSNGYYASQVAAPVFAEIAQYGLRLFRIPPPAEAFVSHVPAPVVAEQPVTSTPTTTGPVRNEAATVPSTTVPATDDDGSTTTATTGVDGEDDGGDDDGDGAGGPTTTVPPPPPPEAPLTGGGSP
jgi:cell division protein FtsI (penicillin-binding protein 3)